MDGRIVTVFGGTGFLGRPVVRHLQNHGFRVRVASRHARPEAASETEWVRADIRDQAARSEALAGSWAVVNAVSLYVERGGDTFHAVHVEAARDLALQARHSGLARLIHVSGVGADPASPSLYIHKRGEGEAAVREAFPNAVIVRPSVMFGPEGGLVSLVLNLMRRLPVYPLFGRGRTRLQPVSAEDVAEGIARILLRPTAEPPLYELGGPQVFTYEEFLRTVAREAGLNPFLVPFPFAGWHVLARVSELLPHPPVTRNQVELMEVDTVVSPHIAGLAELGIEPTTIEAAVRDLTSRSS